MLYENEESLSHEEVVRTFLSKKYPSFLFEKTCEKYFVDNCIVNRNGRLIALAEIKWRPSYTMDDIGRMGGYMLSAYKFCNALLIANTLDIGLSLFVKDSKNDIYSANLRKVKKDLDYTDGFFRGNKKFRREGDKEPVVYLKPHVFQLLTV